MAFKDMKVVEQVAVEVALTVDQENAITDAFAQGVPERKIKHLVKGLFTPGVSFHHLIAPHVQKLKRVESVCLEEMKSKTPPATQGELETRVRARFPDEHLTMIDHVVGKVVAATGSFTDYEKAFADRAVLEKAIEDVAVESPPE